jgi:hypothetical protein
MTDYAKLRTLAEQALAHLVKQPDTRAWARYLEATEPLEVIALLDDIERLRAEVAELDAANVDRLAAVAKARDEACDLAEWWMDHNDGNLGKEIDSVACSDDRRQLTALRKVGR